MEIRKLSDEEARDLVAGHRTLAQILGVPVGLLAEAIVFGRNSLLAGDLQGAEVMARGVIAADDRYAYGHCLLASTRLFQGRVEEAVVSARAALDRAGTDGALRDACLGILAQAVRHAHIPAMTGTEVC